MQEIKLESVVVLNVYIRLQKALFVLCLTIVSFNVLADKSSEFYEKALTSFKNEDIETTYIHLKNSLKEDEDNLPAKILMGKVLLRSGYVYEAETILEEALNAGADQNLVVDTLGKTWLFTGHNKKIIEANFRNLNGKSKIDWLVLVATAKLNLRKVDEARKDYETILQLEPTSTRTINALASLELQDENYDASLKYIEKSLAINDNDSTTWRIKGDLALAQQQLEDAIDAYLKGYEIDPESPIIKRSLVTGYLQNQDIPSAKQLLNDVLSQTPDDPTATLLKAWLLAKDQNNEEASKELEKLSSNLAGLTEEALRDDPSLIYLSALSAFAQNNYQQAKTYFTQYLTFVPNNINAVSLLAQTYVQLGNPKLGLESMQRHERELLENLDSALLLGELYLINDKSFKTVDLISKLQKQYPDELRVELLEIKTFIARGLTEQALKMLNESKSGESHPAFIVTKARLFLNTQRHGEALQIANKLLEMTPNNVDFLNLKAASLIKLRQWDDAEAEITKVLELNPYYDSALFNLATIKNAKGEYSQALEIMQDLNEKQPDSIKNLLMLARSQASIGDTEDAKSNLERVLEKDIGNQTAMQLMANIYSQAGEYEKAVRQLNVAIKTAPDEPRYQLQRIRHYIQLGQESRAQRELNKVSKLIENEARLLVTLAKLQLSAGQVDKAKASVRRAYESNSNSISLATEFIRLHLSASDIVEAESMTNKWLAKQKNDPQLITLSGDIYATKGKLEEAANKYMEALSVAPTYNLAYAKLYRLTLQQIAVEDFSAVASEILQINPSNSFQRNLLADHYINRGKFDEALPHYEILLNVENMPNKAFILNNLANIYIQKDLAKAETYIKRALELRNNEGALLDTLGWITSLKGDHEGALTILRRAYAMNSNDPSIQYHLAYTLGKLGKNKEALVTINRALSSNIKFNERADAESLKSTL